MKSLHDQFNKAHTFQDDDKKITLPKPCRDCDYVATTVQEVKDNFYRNSTSRDRRNGYCNRCSNVRGKTYRNSAGVRKRRRKIGVDINALFWVLWTDGHLRGYRMELDGKTYDSCAGEHIWSEKLMENVDKRPTKPLPSFSGMEIFTGN